MKDANLRYPMTDEGIGGRSTPCGTIDWSQFWKHGGDDHKSILEESKTADGGIAV
jgi:hypothetical protein